MALENVVEVHDGKVVGAYASQAKNVSYKNGSVEDALDELSNIYIPLGGYTANNFKAFMLGVMRSVKALNLSLNESGFIRCIWNDHAFYCGFVCRISSDVITYVLSNHTGSNLYCGNYLISGDSVIAYQYNGSPIS